MYKDLQEGWVLQLQKMRAVVRHFVDGLMNIGQSGVLLLLFKAAES